MPIGDLGLILLDTHVWVWLMSGTERLRPKARELVREAMKLSNIRVSIISVWEVAMLEAKQRLALSSDCTTWVDQALNAPGVSLATLTAGAAIGSSRLPGEFHGDPADRIIVASARDLQATLLTRDRRILDYSKQGHVKAVLA